VKRASNSREIVAWRANRRPTFGHLDRIDGK
jgi:hypothetical protein